MTKTFAPWKRDFRIALFLWLLGIAWLFAGGLWVSQEKDWETITVAMIAVVPLYLGFGFYEKGNRRRHGIKIEQRAIEAFKRLRPERWEVESNWSIGKRGSNLDMVVRLPDARRYGIEIKSWHRWHRKSAISRRRAAGQILRHCATMRIEKSVIWLPEAKLPETIHEKNIFVVEGSPKYLLSILSEMIQFHVLIKFPSTPSDNVRAQIKKYRFQWHKGFSHWTGKLTQQEIDILEPVIQNEKGSLVVERQF